MGKLDEQAGERSLARSQAHRELDAAKRELRYSGNLAVAASSLCAAWDALAEDGGADEAGEARAAPGGLERAIWRESLSRVRALIDSRGASSDNAERDPADPLVLLDLWDQVDWLSRAIAARERSRRAGLRWSARVRNPSIPAALGVAAVAALAFATLAAEPPTSRPWRASLHPNIDLSGEAGEVVIRHHARVDFAWGRRSPVPGLVADAFSVRWDVCLRVPEARAGRADPRRLRFELRSDDGARLWLDDRRLLETWDRRGLSEQSGDASLAPGPHHLRLEYRDIKGLASISLRIEVSEGEALGADRPSIASEWLAPPPEPFRPGDPCRLAKGGPVG